MAKNIFLFQAFQIRYSVPNRKQVILKINSLSVEKGKCYFILGENGAGKSSLLAVMGGYLAPDSGQLFWKEKTIKPLSERLVKGFEGISLVKQEPELNPFLTAGEELFKALRHLPDRACSLKKNELVRVCRLKPILLQKTGNLSGGEKRRLAIAIALAKNAEMLLLDEPFSDLDYPAKAIFRAMLLDLKQVQQTALVIVSHQGEDSYWLADQLLTMEKGRWIEKLDRTVSGFNPKLGRTARLLGWKNVVDSSLLASPIFKSQNEKTTFVYIPPNAIRFSPTKHCSFAL